jgi:hypothetical protein
MFSAGAKLALFNSGGVCQNCPAKTDDACSKFLFLATIFTYMGETLIFGPISAKFRSINSTQFPLKAL